MNNAEHEPLITKAPLRTVVREETKHHTYDGWVKPIAVDMEPKFTAWERVQLGFDATLQATKIAASLTPHIISIIWSYIMGNKTKLSIAIVGLLVAVAGHMGFVIPEALIPFIDTAVALLLGWLIPAPTAKTEEPKP